MRNTKPVDLELKDDVKPVRSHPYPVPIVHEAILRKEVDRLVFIGVLKRANDSEWGAPYFAQPKAKTNRVQFLRYFQHLNRQLKHDPYPMPKIRGMILKVEGFNYATSLDLNMGYYRISLSEDANNPSLLAVPA